MCLACGFYKGKMVLDLAAKKKDRDERIAAKAALRRADQGETALAQSEEKATV
jgi:hypothetical protein